MKICSRCEDNTEANFSCKECQETLCDPCHKAHLKVKLTRNHTIIPLQHWGSSPLPENQFEAIYTGKLPPLMFA